MYVRLTGPSKYVCMLKAPCWACMYVCLRQLSVYVCMYVSGSWACMYVCLRQLSVYVCMSQVAERVCMYVSGNWACMYVCMSQTYIHTNSWSVAHDPSWACMYVPKPRVLSSVWRLRRNAPHPFAWPLGDPQKVIHIDTILILVYIHTYILTIRSSH